MQQKDTTTKLMKTPMELALARIELMKDISPDSIHWQMFKDHYLEMEKQNIIDAVLETQNKMNKIEEIFRAWGIAFNPSDEQAQIGSDRIEICNTCEHKRTSPIIHCGLCGCALRGKIYTPVDGACPAGKWPMLKRQNS